MPRKTASMTTEKRLAQKRFNEAAARCRGKRGRPTRRVRFSIRFNEAAARCRGKRRGDGRLAAGHPASMRPRPDAAENARVVAAALYSMTASMRPRPDAAENGRDPDPQLHGAPRFNEAAARCRGKRGTARAACRPRPGFNEAAARCRGKPGEPAFDGRGPGRFNEAAARCRGKLPTLTAICPAAFPLQ